MHPNDLMTPKERMAGLKAGKNIDRMPIFVMLSSLPSRLAGFSYREGFSNEKNISKCLVTTYNRFGHDSVSLSYGLHGIGRALGSKLNNPENTVPAIEKHLLDDLNDISHLDFEKTQMKNDINLQIRHNALDLTNEAIGGEVGLSFGITGPFTSASSLFPPEKMLRSLRKEPEKVHQLLSFVTDCLLGIIDDFAPMENISMSIADPVASGSLLSQKQYCEFVLPYTKRLVDRMHHHNKSVTYHICGDTTSILEDMASAGPNGISLDNKVDLAHAKKVIGHKVQIVGNVDPVNYLLLGNPQTIDEAVRHCFKNAYGSDKGFFISTGCDLPLDTPFENVDYYMESCRKYAKYPIDTSLFL